MKIFLSAFILLSICQINLLAQKASLDTSVFDSWPTLQLYPQPSVSLNGAFAFYYQSNQACKDNILFIKDLCRRRSLRISEGRDAIFAKDSKIILFKRNDSLFSVNLASMLPIPCLDSVSSFNLVENSNNQVVLCKRLGKAGDLTILNLKNKSVKTLRNIRNYQLIFSSRKIIFITEYPLADTIQSAIHICSLTGQDIAEIWRGSSVDKVILHKDGRKIAFISKQHNNIKQLVIKDNINNSFQVLHISGDIQNLSGFSFDGRRIFVKMNVSNSALSSSSSGSVIVWRTTDIALKNQLVSFATSIPTLYSLFLEDGKLVQLQHSNEEIQLNLNNPSDSLAFVTSSVGNWGERSWYPLFSHNRWVVSTITGEKKFLNHGIIGLSPGGRYLYGSDDSGYYFNDLAKGRILRVQKHSFQAKSESSLPNLEAWEQTDSYALFSDEFDIWKLEFVPFLKLTCLTNHTGKTDNISFKISSHQMKRGVVKPLKHKLILIGTNQDTQESGFFEVLLKSGLPIQPKKLFFGHYSFEISGSDINNAVLLKKASDRDFPNWFVTKDFKTLSPITDLHPQDSYNWIGSQLVPFKSITGENSKAILYTPQNFDSTKRYPVIFYIYEQFSQRTYQYLVPLPFNGGINIPWLVSRGYIVCTPDIIYKSGQPGKSAFDCVMGVVDRLSSKRWIDTSKMAICGHSFGGYETNYIITHTSVFRAAYSAAGVSDLISFYGTLSRDGLPLSPVLEAGQLRMDNHFYYDPSSYIDNSPLFFADRVSCPVLLMHNTGDGSVPFSQGVEFFIALRRLKKKAWLIQYQDEGHTLGQSKNAKDLTIKVTDFFDHYLKQDLSSNWLE